MKNTKIIYASTEKTPIVLTDMESLLPPLTAEQFSALEADIVKNGCYSPIVVDQNLSVIDGHNRLKVCGKHHLPYQMAVFEFTDMLEAKQWALETQKARRNLDLWELGRIALRLKPELEAKGRANQSAAGGDKSRKALSKNSTKAPVERIDTRQQMAESVGISADSMGRIMKIDGSAPEVVRNALEKKEISLNQAYTITREVLGLPEEERAESAAEALQEIRESKKSGAKHGRQNRSACAFSTVFEKAVRLEAEEENVRRWVTERRMNADEMEMMVRDAVKISETFYNIGNILRKFIAVGTGGGVSVPGAGSGATAEMKNNAKEEKQSA